MREPEFDISNIGEWITSMDDWYKSIANTIETRHIQEASINLHWSVKKMSYLPYPSANPYMIYQQTARG